MTEDRAYGTSCCSLFFYVHWGNSQAQKSRRVINIAGFEVTQVQKSPCFEVPMLRSPHAKVQKVKARYAAFLR